MDTTGRTATTWAYPKYHQVMFNECEVFVSRDYTGRVRGKQRERQ